MLERKLKKGTEVIIERKLDERGSKGTKKVRETAVVDDVYSHIFFGKAIKWTAGEFQVRPVLFG